MSAGRSLPLSDRPTLHPLPFLCRNRPIVRSPVTSPAGRSTVPVADVNPAASLQGGLCVQVPEGRSARKLSVSPKPFNCPQRTFSSKIERFYPSVTERLSGNQGHSYGTVMEPVTGRRVYSCRPHSSSGIIPLFVSFSIS